MRILFFGTPEFAAASLELIAQEGFNVVAVVTAPDKPAGRGRQLKSSDVKVSAEKLNIPVFQPSNLKSEDFLNQINSLNIDFITDENQISVALTYNIINTGISDNINITFA